jgi:archaellum component FlaF (FlaF/FlaG flagellin family)
MKVALIALLLFFVMCFVALSRRRAAVREAEAAAQARSRTATARNKARVPTVSNNVKGVAATQSIEPLRPGSLDDEYVDDR